MSAACAEWRLCAASKMAIFVTAGVGFGPLAAQDTDPGGRTAEASPAIVVTGSRLPRGVLDDPGPIQVLTVKDLTESALPNLEQTLNQLPQIVGSLTTTSNNPGTGAATLDLRGLGATRTLVLVNGRRWISSDAGDVPEVDINTISSALIERVDIVTGGASTVYGSDAVTGVVNFVMRDSIDGIHLQARQSVTGRGDGPVSSADLTAGIKAFEDRLKITGSVGWLDQQSVFQGDRTRSSVALVDGCGVPGTRQPTGASQPLPARSCPDLGEITLVAGGSATIPGSRFAAPAFFPTPGGGLAINFGGLRFDPDGAARPFVAPVDLYNYAPQNYLQIPFRRYSANLFGSFAASEAAEPYVELTFVDTGSSQQLAPVPAMIGGGSDAVPVVRINLANPFLTAQARDILELNYGVDANGARGVTGSPATGPMRNPVFLGDADGIVSLPSLLATRLDLGPRQVRNRRKAYRALGGLRGRFAQGWDYDLYASHSDVTHTSAYRNSGSAARLQQALLAVRDPATGEPICIDRSNGCVPANIFGAGNLSEEAAAFLRTHPRDRTTVEETIAEGSIKGSLDLGIGIEPVAVAAGVNWRRTAYRFEPDPALFTGDDLGFLPGIPASGSTRSVEAFAESRIELARNLSTEIGARLSLYDGIGSALTWKVAGNWEALPGLRLRGGYQRAVRAPNARELYEAPLTIFGGVADPCDAAYGRLDEPAIVEACLRNGVPADVLGGEFIEGGRVTTLGNPDLQPEIADTWTLGAVARLGRGDTSLAIDFYDIRIRQAIGVFGGGANFTVIGCLAGGGDPADPLCAAYTRAADGSIDVVTLPTANTGLLSARGVDWQAAARFSLGRDGSWPRLNLRLSGTYYLRSGFKINAELPYIDCAGRFGGTCGNTIGGAAVPRWKLFDSVELDFGDATVMLRHRWFSATHDSRSHVADRLGLEPPLLTGEGRRLEARHYFDLGATLRFGEGRALVLGMANVLGAKPALTGSLQVQANTDPSLYDVLGRRFYVLLDLKM